MKDTQKRLLVKVIADGHEYRIYENGQAEGFGENFVIVNCYPILLREELHRQRERERSGANETSIGSFPTQGQRADQE